MSEGCGELRSVGWALCCLALLHELMLLEHLALDVGEGAVLLLRRRAALYFWPRYLRCSGPAEHRTIAEELPSEIDELRAGLDPAVVVVTVRPDVDAWHLRIAGAVHALPRPVTEALGVVTEQIPHAADDLLQVGDVLGHVHVLVDRPVRLSVLRQNERALQSLLQAILGLCVVRQVQEGDDRLQGLDSTLLALEVLVLHVEEAVLGQLALDQVVVQLPHVQVRVRQVGSIRLPAIPVE